MLKPSLDQRPKLCRTSEGIGAVEEALIRTSAQDVRKYRLRLVGQLACHPAKLRVNGSFVPESDPDPPSNVDFCTLAEQDDLVVGFAICVLHEGTWSTQPVCYLEDLFVAPEQRGAGIGRAIINDLCQRGAEAGWAQLYWSTHRNNPGRKLYDEFTQADESVRYRLDVKLRPSDA